MKNICIIIIVTLFIQACEKKVMVDVAPQLEITVVNTEDVKINNAKITLYETEEEWGNKTNPLRQNILTDINGIALIKELEEKVYFIYAEKEDKSNLYETAELKSTLKLNEILTLTITIR